MTRINSVSLRLVWHHTTLDNLVQKGANLPMGWKRGLFVPRVRLSCAQTMSHVGVGSTKAIVHMSRKCMNYKCIIHYDFAIL